MMRMRDSIRFGRCSSRRLIVSENIGRASTEKSIKDEIGFINQSKRTARGKSGGRSEGIVVKGEGREGERRVDKRVIMMKLNGMRLFVWTNERK